MNAWAAKLGMKDSQFKNPTGWMKRATTVPPRHGPPGSGPDPRSAGGVQDLLPRSPSSSTASPSTTATACCGINPCRWTASRQVTSARWAATWSSATNNEGMRLIAVVLGASSEATRAAESKKLLTYGFRFFQSLTLAKASGTGAG